MNNIKEQLKPCPFCNSTDIEMEADTARSYAPYCHGDNGECCCRGPLADTPEEAARLWNTRAYDSPQRSSPAVIMEIVGDTKASGGTGGER